MSTVEKHVTIWSDIEDVGDKVAKEYKVSFLNWLMCTLH
jgi:hypothetical protein